MNKKLIHILNTLEGYQFSLTNEKKLQIEIEEIFQDNNIDYKREERLGDVGVVDFIVDNIAIEIKVKGNSKAIYRQCEKYCSHKKVDTLILVTGKTVGMPGKINNKEVYTVNLGEAHL